MDARQVRTWSRLREAVLQLARERPIDEVSVTELARGADVSRDTFYRYADSSAGLLAGVLGEELDNLDLTIETVGDSEDLEVLFDRAERALLQHVADFRAVYLNAMSPRLAAPLRFMLVDRLERSLTDYLDRFPELAPAPPGDLSASESHQVYAAYGAAGTVGVIEHWLRTGAVGDADDIARGVLAVSATWWWRGQ